MSSGRLTTAAPLTCDIAGVLLGFIGYSAWLNINDHFFPGRMADE